MQMKKYVVLNENIWVDFILQEGFFLFYGFTVQRFNSNKCLNVYKYL